MRSPRADASMSSSSVASSTMPSVALNASTALLTQKTLGVSELHADWAPWEGNRR